MADSTRFGRIQLSLYRVRFCPENRFLGHRSSFLNASSLLKDGLPTVVDMIEGDMIDAETRLELGHLA